MKDFDPTDPDVRRLIDWCNDAPPIHLELTAFTMLSLVGQLQLALALRQDANQHPSAELVRQFLDDVYDRVPCDIERLLRRLTDPAVGTARKAESS